MPMNREARAAWVARGFKDPVKAYRTHAADAGMRGIEFRLTFDEWWSYWEPHYTERGRGAGQKCMCRTGDKGAYEVGNVRIDTNKANAEERSVVYRKSNLEAGRLPLAQDRSPGRAGWLFRRRCAFDVYHEDEEENPWWSRA